MCSRIFNSTSFTVGLKFLIWGIFINEIKNSYLKPSIKIVLIVHQYFNFPASEFAFKAVYFNSYVITPSAQWIFGLFLQIISVLTSGYSVFSLQLNVKYCVKTLVISSNYVQNIDFASLKKYGKRPPISVHILVILKVLVHLLLQTVFSYSIVSILVGNPRFQCGLLKKDCYSHTRYKLPHITLKVYSRVFVSNFWTKLLSLHFWIYFVPNVSGSCNCSKFYYGCLYKF